MRWDVITEDEVIGEMCHLRQGYNVKRAYIPRLDYQPGKAGKLINSSLVSDL